MRKLAAVEDAKALMTEATNWGLWKWLTEKSRVRAAADAAWAALGEAEQKVKAAWPDALKQAYDELAAQGGKRRAKREAVPAAIQELAERVKAADDEAYRAHMDAEDIFAEADKRLSTSRAREGAARAIEAWELTEKAIRRAEAAGKR